MLFTNLLVDVPSSGVYVQRRGKDSYVYQFTDAWKDENGQRKTSRKRKMIGKTLMSSREQMHPNAAYYELRGLKVPEPDYSKVALPGRHSSVETGPGAVTYPGFALACDIVLQRLGIKTFLEESFGETKSDQISLLASLYASGRDSLGNLEALSITHNCWQGAKNLTTQAASRLFASLQPPEIRDFFSKWCQKAAGNDNLAYDVTAFTTRAQKIREAEYGYTHGTVGDYPLVNFALLCNERTELPVFYTHYMGSLTDKTNLVSVLSTAKDRGVPGGITMVIDRGMVSGDNLKSLTELGYHFIAGVPGTIKSARSRLAEYADRPVHVAECFSLGSKDPQMIHGTTEDFEWHGLKLKLHLYINDTVYSAKAATFMQAVQTCQEVLQPTRELPDSPFLKEAVSCFEQVSNQWVFNEQKARVLLKQLGAFALISSPKLKLNARDALLHYRRREVDEACFDCLKNDLSGLPLNLHDQKRLDGKFFVLFIALIIKKTIMALTKDLLQKTHRNYSNVVNALEAQYCEIREEQVVTKSQEGQRSFFQDTAVVNKRTRFAKALLYKLLGPVASKKLGLKDPYTPRIPRERKTGGRKEISRSASKKVNCVHTNSADLGL